MTRERSYTVVLRPEPEGGFTATVPTLPPIVTFGPNQDEAIAMAEDAIRLYVDYLELEGQEVPEEHAPATMHRVTLAT